MSFLTSEELEFNRKVVPILKDVYADEVALQPFGRRREILDNFLQLFRSMMVLLDPALNLLFNRYLYTGSAFEGLQVKDVDEFDIDIILKFPSFFNNKYRLIEADHPASFAKFQLTEPLDVFHKILLQQFFDPDGYLMSDKVRTWCQSLVDRFLDIGLARTVAGIEDIRSTNSGPARTLKIKLRNDPIGWISVDLVPVFAVNCRGHLNKITYFRNVVPSQKMDECILVPKPVHGTFNRDVHRLWRLHFPDAEASIMENRQFLKPLIKLIKRLRDVENLYFPSYFVKTVAFWMVKEHPEEDYFAERLQGIRFLQMLEALEKYLSDGHLGHIFYPSFNLLERMSPQLRIDQRNRIKKIINIIKWASQF